MKKTFFALTFVAALLFAQNVFASSSPSLDGRAVVAKSGTFPKGFFAKTVGYLPGDSIIVTNPVNSRQVSILVIGSLDASEGVAILLSPEAAEALSIKRDSNNLVKLTKRNGTADKVANGSAVITNVLQEEAEDWENEIAESEDVSEEIAEAAEDDESESASLWYERSKIPSEEFDEVEEIAEDTENDVSEAEEVFEDIPEETEDAIAEEILEEESDEIAYERVEDYYIPEDSFGESGEAEELFEDIPEEREEESDEVVYERVEDYYIPEDTDERAEIDEGFDEIPEEKVELAEIPEEAESDEIVYERVEDYCIPEDADEMSETDEGLGEIPEEKVEVVESKPVSEDETVCPESEVAEKDSEMPGEDEYEAIVLVPTEENPPEASDKELDKKSVAPAVSKSEDASKSAAKSEPHPKGDAVYVNSAADLESQKYYVQIAVYTKNEHVEQLAALYGGRYPLTILDEGARKIVLVGPLGMDEYGTALERFKLFGFDDAFVRQAK